ncbi:hypothetical protein BDK51DRAFT_32964 [Blyttiomyces helicus]|uniref:Uncharacterized protein n=1 Tax=Blyttiomyces helicus TaxID=388810 RepID=A0A4P9W3H8_9FUNG|nr:hypothetical protein BDK51DRAFT_32964 [Blyttiomyces helicus]|eukprot:RKO84686.1 hypothetical protein BDK51DRAFT_32964 [Blyttiomyces helicus]
MAHRVFPMTRSSMETGEKKESRFLATESEGHFPIHGWRQSTLLRLQCFSQQSVSLHLVQFQASVPSHPVLVSVNLRSGLVFNQLLLESINCQHLRAKLQAVSLPAISRSTNHFRRFRPGAERRSLSDCGEKQCWSGRKEERGRGRRRALGNIYKGLLFWLRREKLKKRDHSCRCGSGSETRILVTTTREFRTSPTQGSSLRLLALVKIQTLIRRRKCEWWTYADEVESIGEEAGDLGEVRNRWAELRVRRGVARASSRCRSDNGHPEEYSGDRREFFRVLRGTEES